MMGSQRPPFRPCPRCGRDHRAWRGHTVCGRCRRELRRLDAEQLSLRELRELNQERLRREALARRQEVVDRLEGAGQ